MLMKLCFLQHEDRRVAIDGELREGGETSIQRWRSTWPFAVHQQYPFILTFGVADDVAIVEALRGEMAEGWRQALQTCLDASAPALMQVTICASADMLVTCS